MTIQTKRKKRLLTRLSSATISAALLVTSNLLTTSLHALTSTNFNKNLLREGGSDDVSDYGMATINSCSDQRTFQGK